jgi:methyl-accepting chemotaxis protein
MITSNITNLDSMSMVKAKVDFYNGSTLAQTCYCIDYLEDFELTREGDNSKFFGFGICHRLDFNLVDLYRNLDVAKDYTVELGLGDGTIWDAPYPTFHITELKRNEKTNTITATSYDNLYWASEYLFEDLGLDTTYTIWRVAQAVATKLGLTLNVPTAILSDFLLSYPEGANLEKTEDLRSILNWIAETTQTVYYVNSQNQLTFKRLDRDGEAVKRISRDLYYELDTKTPRTLVTICNTTELGDNVEIALEDETGAIQYIRNNPFLELRTDLVSILEKAKANVCGTTITQINCDWSGDYTLEIGDKIALETEDGGEVYSYVLSDTIVFAGTLNEKTEWDYTDQQPETYANPTNIGERINQTFAKVDKIEKKITLYVSEVVDEILPTKIDEALETFEGTITQEIEEALEPYGKDITDLKATTSKNTQNIATLVLDTKSITNEVSSLKETTTTLTDGLGEVVATQTEIQEDIGSLQVTSSQINASVSSVEQKVTNVADQLENHTDVTTERIEALTRDVSLKLDKKGVEIAIENTLSEGVEKVVTASKKYTFDDTGLSISSGDSDISTKVTEDGMRIYRHSSEVLTVDNTGVQAADLHARTFLIIGENSRLEDRGSRTACFWIGPAGG